MGILKNAWSTLQYVFGGNPQGLGKVAGRSPAEAMRQMRLRALREPPGVFGFAPTEAYPRVYGVVMDMPMGKTIATLVSLADGVASLYTTSDFGVVGGEFHETVRAAARRLVTAADEFVLEASPADGFPYPMTTMVHIYLLTFEGVKLIEAELRELAANRSRYAPLFWLGQEVFGELRRSTSKPRD